MKKILKIITITSAIIISSLNMIWASEFQNKMLEEESKRVGEEIFQRLIDVVGDFALVENVNTISEVTKELDQVTIAFRSEVFAVFPDKIHLKYEDKEFIINEDNGWKKYPQGYYENLSKKMIQVLGSNLEKNMINIIKNREDFTIRFKEITYSNGKEYEILEFINDSKQSYISDFLLYIDVETYLPHKMIYSGTGKSMKTSELVLEKTYLDFMDLMNYKYPSHTVTSTLEGEKISENKILNIKTNLEFDKNLFQ